MKPLFGQLVGFVLFAPFQSVNMDNCGVIEVIDSNAVGCLT